MPMLLYCLQYTLNFLFVVLPFRGLRLDLARYRVQEVPPLTLDFGLFGALLGGELVMSLNFRGLFQLFIPIGGGLLF